MRELAKIDAVETAEDEEKQWEKGECRRRRVSSYSEDGV
jgi:hypothetical protein